MEKKLVLKNAGKTVVSALGMTLTALAICFYPIERANALVDDAKSVAEVQQEKSFDGMKKDFHMKGCRYMGKHHKGMPTPEMKEKFAKKLGLTDEQKAEIEKFRQEDMAKMVPLMEKMDELRKQMKKLREENRHRFESVLTAEQKDILKKMHEERKAKKDEFMKERWDFDKIADAPETADKI